jgi:pimeloyl-ACP methyl ester carboxylesterase
VADLYRSAAHESEVRRWCSDRLHAWQVPHTTRSVSTGLGDTHLTFVGEGADVCVYLPGTNFNAATSTGVLARLSEHCRVVCADLPGQPGLSASRRPGDETQGYAAWVGEVLEESRRGSGRVVLMGHSRGAAAALLAEPDTVDALILLSPAGLARVRMTPSLLLRSVTWLLRPTRRRSARLVELMAGGAPGDDLDRVVEWMTIVARSTRTTGAPGPLAADVLDRWRGRQVRMLAGERDIFFPPRRLAGPAREHLGERVEIVPDVGHLLVDQRPDVAAVALADALGRHGPG